MKKKNKKYTLILLLLILILGIGYATIRTNLNILGTTTIKNNNFVINFSNIQEKTGSVTPVKTATIGSDNVSVSFDVTLSNPGEYYGFSIDVVNSGTLDAVIKSFEKSELTTDQQKYLTYEITYSDGTAITEGDTLNKDTTKTINVLLTYKENPEEYPTTSEQEINYTFAVVYIEAGATDEENDNTESDENITTVERTTANSYAQTLPEDLTSETNLYTALTPQEGYYDATGYTTLDNINVVSIVIPVIPGDKITASSFDDSNPTSSSVIGIRVTYLKDNDIVLSKTPAQIYSEYTTNGYITVPEGVNAVSIPWWSPSDENWAYLIS